MSGGDREEHPGDPVAPKPKPEKDAGTPSSKRVRAAIQASGAEREHSRRHLHRLYEVSKLITTFTGVEATVPEVFRLVTNAIPLRSAILIEEIDGRPRTTVWHAPDVDPSRLRRAESWAKAGYAYLVPGSGEAPRDLDVVRRVSAAFEKRPPGEPSAEADLKDYIVLPLVTDHLPIAGALQVEPARALDVYDLAFLNGVANQLAIALDRHNAWNKERALRAEAERLGAENLRLLEEARAAVRARDEFISVASHELRGPITALDLQAQLLARKPVGMASVEDWQKGSEALGRQTAKLSLLVGKLLDATRLSLGKLVLEIEDLDLAALVREVADHLAPDAVRAKSTIALSVPGPILGRWDPVRLEQVVANLLSNAIKYGRGAPIELDARRAGRGATITVRDKGPGIPPEDHERIFKRYERASGETRTSGLGLGLYITREIIERHGGEIRLTSSPGEGSTFTVELPLEPPPEPR